MRDALRVGAYAGTVLLLFGILSFGLTGNFDLWTAVHVTGGGLLLLIGLAGNLAGVRRTVAARGTRERAFAATGTLVFAALVVALNVLAARFPKTWDVTENKVYTLSPRTLSVLASLKRPVELVAFFPQGDRGREPIAELAARYTGKSDKVTFKFVDPEKDPQLADQLGVTKQGTLAARSGDDKAQAAADNGAVDEGELTNLLLKVARPGGVKLYAVTGHGEPDVADVETPTGWGRLAVALKEDNVEIRPLLLATAPSVPDDAAAVLLASPAKPLLPHEIDALRSWLAKGGRLLAMIDPGQTPGLDALFADYRLALDDDMIVDKEEIAFLGARLGLDPIVEDFPPHPITKGFKQRILLSQARSITIEVEGGLPGVVAQPLARTHDTAWGETGWRAMMETGRVAKDAADKDGPLVVAATATAEVAGDPDAPADTAKKQARLVLVGDADWVANGNLGNFFNREMLVNVLHWLTGSEDLIVGPPKALRASRLDMTVADQRNLFRFGVLLLPEVLLIGGLVAWLRRKAL
ncbi:MAG TPA: DUF4350 domain-containing protein [Candidatus Polarisedimenticolaceae bacterium]|nr:DUF4350 domain-containing protein [Candidatus Polarisedimenticolaceae bacterium]